MKLIIDNRENIKELFHVSENVTFDNLEIGDYLIKNEEKEILIIERKTINDYCALLRWKK